MSIQPPPVRRIDVTKEVIGGYAMLEAKSKAEAIELTKRFLELHGDEWELECEVRQLDTGCVELPQ